MSQKPYIQASGVQLPLPAVWKSLSSEPGTGIAVLDAEGTILFLNQQTSTIYFGGKKTIEELVGRRLGDFFPESWTKERLALLDDVERTGENRMLRTIWLGYQVISCVHGLASSTPGRRFDKFLVIARRCRGEVFNATGAKAEQFIESKVASLGPLDALSDRELEVLAFLAQGLSAKEIAAKIHRSVRTVEGHRLSVGRKLKTDDRVQLARIAKRAGLMPRDVNRIRLDSESR